MENRILRRKVVQERTGLPQSTLYSLIAQNKFPKPITLNKRSVGWLESEITGWISKKIEASRKNS